MVRLSNGLHHPAVAPIPGQAITQAVGGQSEIAFGSPKGRQPITCLLEQSARQTQGVGPTIEVEEFRGKLLVITLEIDLALERETLWVSIWGSLDKIDWGIQPLVRFSERSYCGLYSTLLNLADRPEIRYLRVEWKMKRWTKGVADPLFGFSIFMQASGSRVSTAKRYATEARSASTS